MCELRLSVTVLLGMMVSTSGAARASTPDWLLNPQSFRATVREDAAKKQLILENGLARRVILLAPNAATIGIDNVTSNEALLRAVGPEARITLDGKDYAVGGLQGQPVKNYLKPEWIKDLRDSPDAYRFTGWTQGPIEARFPWKKHREWMARDLPWPPPGKHVVLSFQKPSSARIDLPTVEVHYELYDGLPLFSKWVVVKNATPKPVRVNRFIAEELRLAEVESNVEGVSARERPNLWVETDYAFLAMDPANASSNSVVLEADPDYPTQVHYERRTPCLLRCRPPLGPDQEIAPGKAFESFRVFELLIDSTERERRGLAQRRMYRTIAPWTTENPLMFHLRVADEKSIRAAIEQASEVGFEMIILSFGSGFNFESTDAKYLETYRKLAALAREKKLVLGGYSLLASRGAPDRKDNTQGVPARFGVMPCLGSKWGGWYLGQLKRFLHEADLGVLEHDGSYPGDRCASHDHPGHRGVDDSQWVQWRAITDFYKWCRAEGIYLNIPDWYFLAGGSKTGMGYRETNWSLPRAEQEIIERQNIYDGTWTKTCSMGWMFVPLSEYHGGGAAATIEPLHKHLDHYESRLANLLGAGVQACYRGPRLYDTDETRDMVKKWVAFFKKHREALDGDLIHLRRPDGRDWDGWLHVNPEGKEKGLAFFYNPLPEPIERDIRVPLYFTGLGDAAHVSIEGAAGKTMPLDRAATVTIKVKIPARGRTWIVFARPEN